MSQDERHHGEDDPQAVRDLFNRSPHPYNRPSFDSSERIVIQRTKGLSINPKDSKHKLSRQASDRRSFISSTSASDSGTEADDEKPLLRALTAPPARPRKGLKGIQGEDGTISPSLTQSGNDGNGTRVFSGDTAVKRKKHQSGEAKIAPKNYVRKSFETNRRVFELVLLTCIGWISLHRLEPQAATTFAYHALIVTVIFFSYFPKLLWRLFRNRAHGQPWLRIWFPASADPACLIYPVFLPLIVTYLTSTQEDDAISNYILSFCAIPKQAMLLEDFTFHWTISTIPLILKSLYNGANTTNGATEELLLLFPLHMALMQTLYFLTTTSLLTTELQLLSIALINLLGVPKTPQASILKALLWVGGLAMLVSCRHVLQLSVELARVPTWRLRRVQYHRHNRSTIFCAIDDTLGGFLSRRIFTSRNSHDSDSEDDSWSPYTKGSLYRRRSLQKRTPSTRSITVEDLVNDRHTPASLENMERLGSGTRQRRHTLPESLSNLPDIPTITRTATDALSSAKTRSRLIVRLTLSQATVLKWLYAAFVYVITILVILVPVRLYVQYFALESREPIGWALGYLFGNYQPFRMQVVLWNLDSWICLPSRELPVHVGLGEYTRQVVWGAANTRLLISAYCLFWIAVGLAVVIYLSNIVEVDTRRKVFHGMMVAMFLPTIFIDPTFIALAFTLILAIFLLLDLFRASQLPPLSQPLTYFLAPYVDGRDHKGPIVISHIFLLIGCAIPLWLSLAAVDRTGQGALTGWEVPTRDLSMVTGVICVGMGDAAASLIGRRYGRRRWSWSGGKSLEGSAAFAFAVFIGLAVSKTWLKIGGWPGASEDSWMVSIQKMVVAGIGSSLTEAVLTGGNDNVVVPIILWLLTKGLAI